MTKRCGGCGVVKLLDEFYRQSKARDGRQSICKACALDYQRQYRARSEGPPRTTVWAAANAARAREYRRRWRQQNPEKVIAQRQLNEAVLRNRVVRPSGCESCGNKGRVQAHHDDYSKPLDVVWLCVGCHRRQHRKEEAA